MNLYPNVKSKELRKRLIQADIEAKKKTAEDFKKMLPREGSLLRQLVDIEITKLTAN